MALQLTGAFKKDSIANLQLRLPAVVIGGGLTAIDTATEALAYYPVQVERFLSRYELLCREQGEDNVRQGWSEEEGFIADEFIAHAQALRTQRQQAKPKIRDLLEKWGGVTIAYRRHLKESPSYRLNHEEVFKALQEGIKFKDEVTPIGVELDHFGHAQALQVVRNGQKESLAAKTVLIAAGTQPNTMVAREYPESFKLDGRFFQAVDGSGQVVVPEKSAKPQDPHVLLATEPSQVPMSYFGDLHPSYHGNVVKAMASAKQGFPVVSQLLHRQPPQTDSLVAQVDYGLRAFVHSVTRLTPTIIEIVVQAPFAAQQFQPGQFYRLQNYETLALQVDQTKLAMEGLALTGASVDKDKGLISLIVLEMGGSSRICAHLRPGEPVVLMGPTGSATEIVENKTVLLIGGGLGNAVLYSIGKAMRQNGCRVLYFAGYRQVEDVFKREEIEAAADKVVWCCDGEQKIATNRPQDLSLIGNVVEALEAYSQTESDIQISEVDRIITIGSDRMMAAVNQARQTFLKSHLKAEHKAIASINSPMQCMMKEICAQCLQTHVDPKTGEETVVFSCVNQDQSMDTVKFSMLSERLKLNSVSEKLTDLWVHSCLIKLDSQLKETGS